MIEYLIPFLALLGSFPVAPAITNINPEYKKAIVRIVPIKNVADNKISCTNSVAEELLLIHNNS